MNNYRPKHFRLEELVPEKVFVEFGERAWQFLDGRQLWTLDQIRSKFGPTFINNWFESGPIQEAGFRDPYARTGALFSQHRMGRADDCHFKLVTPQEVFEYLLAHSDDFPYITAMEAIEKTPTWIHIDCRNSDWSGIKVFQP